MKIISSDMLFSSDHYAEQMDLSIINRKLELREAEVRNPSGNPGQASPRVPDRVSISHRGEFQYHSEYLADVSARSVVSYEDGESTVSHEQQHLVEKLVGGIIDREVTMTRMQRGQDLVLRDGDSIQDSRNGPERSAAPGFLGSPVWEFSVNRTDLHFEQEQLSVSSAGQVKTEDGRTIDFSMDISLDRAFVSRSRQEILVRQQINLVDPLVVSLDGKMPQLSDTVFEFDLDADGTAEQVHFTGAGSGFLAFDRNGDQQINDGSELFGPGTGNGFEELALLDEDQNRWIDENDAVFAQLSVWHRDENGEEQLISLKDAGIGAISLDYAAGLFNMTGDENQLKGQVKGTGMFLFEDGRAGSVHQVDLAAQDSAGPETLKTSQSGLQDTGMLENIPLPGPERILAGPAPQGAVTESQAESRPDPLKELLDKVAALKEKMGRLYERMNFPHPGRRRQDAARQYRHTGLESVGLLPGLTDGIFFPGRRYLR